MTNTHWHYTLNGVQHGPVSREELDRLVAQGSVTGETLVWREGMAGWEPYSRAFVGTPPPTLPGLGSFCGHCGRAVAADEAIALGGRQICAACKPQALQMLSEGASVAGPEVESIRKEHLSHEASVKAVGLLFRLGAIVMGGAGLFMAVGAVMSPGASGPVGLVELIVIAVFCLGFAGFQLWVGLGLRKLRRSGRIAGGIVAAIGLLGFPLGTLINAYVLYLLLSRKGSTIFSDDYRRVIAATPHLKYRTSILTWIVLGALVAVLGFGLVGFVIYFSPMK